MSLLTKNFTSEEMACKCGCKQERMDMSFMLKLQEARNMAGVSFSIASGYRCAKHNAEVGGVDDSAHTAGRAADVFTPDSHARYIVLKALLGVGFKRIGVAGSFIHCDTDDTKAAEVAWLYPGKL